MKLPASPFDAAFRDGVSQIGNNLADVFYTLFRVISYRESGWRPTARNPEGTATGLFQLTWPVVKAYNRKVAQSRRFSLADMAEPYKAIAVARWFLQTLIGRLAEAGFALDWTQPTAPQLVLASYALGSVAVPEAVLTLVKNGIEVSLANALRVAVRQSEEFSDILDVDGIRHVLTMADDFRDEYVTGRAVREKVVVPPPPAPVDEQALRDSRGPTAKALREARELDRQNTAEQKATAESLHEADEATAKALREVQELDRENEERLRRLEKTQGEPSAGEPSAEEPEPVATYQHMHAVEARWEDVLRKAAAALAGERLPPAQYAAVVARWKEWRAETRGPQYVSLERAGWWEDQTRKLDEGLDKMLSATEHTIWGLGFFAALGLGGVMLISRGMK